MESTSPISPSKRSAPNAVDPDPAHAHAPAPAAESEVRAKKRVAYSISDKVSQALDRAIDYGEEEEDRAFRIHIHSVDMVHKVMTKVAWVMEANKATGADMKPFVIIRARSYEGGPDKISWEESVTIPAEKFDLELAKICAQGWMKRDVTLPEDSVFEEHFKARGGVYRNSLGENELAVYHLNVYLGDYYCGK